MRWLKDLSSSVLAGRRVLLRLDLNAPIENGVVRDDFRIKRIVPTVKYLLDAGTRVVILSHLGDREGSLAPVAECLRRFFPVRFGAAGGGENLALLENLRRDPGEENNSPDFACRLAALGDLYVNEAFSASHRPHASIVGLPRLLPSAAGLEFAEEVRQLSRLFHPDQPLLLIVAGAKFGTKLPLVKKFLPLADKIFIGGALAHPLFKLRGYETGRSLCDDLPGLEEIAVNKKIVLPSEVLVKQRGETFAVSPERVPPEAMIVDAGPAAAGQLAELVKTAKTILWNGPLGNYENGFAEATFGLAKLIAASSAHSVVGGGDTIAAVRRLNLFDRFGFVSAAGGAMLKFLAEGTLPGIEALKESR